MRSGIVFVHIGERLPPWLAPALRQARLFNNCPIYLVAEVAALRAAQHEGAVDVTRVEVEGLGRSERHEAFQRLSGLDCRFRDGFWTRTTERFFVLESAIEQLGLANTVHLENDVMLYVDLEELVPRLHHLYPGIAATFDNDSRCIPGFVFIPNAASLSRLTEFILTRFRALQPETVSTTRWSEVNDMSLLGEFSAQGPEAIDCLPIVPPDYPGVLKCAGGHAATSRYSRHFAELGVVFDAAALGQYLGGIDPRNAPPPTVGFINHDCVLDPRLLSPRMGPDGSGRRVPWIETASGRHRVANLHIHAKTTEAFTS